MVLVFANQNNIQLLVSFPPRDPELPQECEASTSVRTGSCSEDSYNRVRAREVEANTRKQELS
jgi:hypothetical protein